MDHLPPCLPRLGVKQQSLVTDVRCRAERGAVLAEYGLLIAVLFIGVASAVAIFHDEVLSLFSEAASTVANEGR